MKKNLVLGAITNYLWYKLEPFFISWKRNFNNCDCIMFTSNLTNSCIQILNNLGVETIPIDGKYACLPPVCIGNYRWILFNDFLKKRGSDYNNVLMCDNRDLIFIDDLFKHYTTESAYIGLALERELIEEDPQWNASWMKNKFGIEEYEKHKNKRAVCSGTIWGTSKELIYLTEKMVEVIYSPKYRLFDPGNDQTTLQFLLYNGYLDNIHICYSDPRVECTVLTLAGFNENEVLNVFDESDDTIAIVHQYDRYSSLSKIVDDRYSFWRYEDISTNEVSIRELYDYIYICFQNHSWDRIIFTITKVINMCDTEELVRDITWPDIIFLLKRCKAISDNLVRYIIEYELMKLLLRTSLGRITIEDIEVLGNRHDDMQIINNLERDIHDTLNRVSEHYKNKNIELTKMIEKIM